MPSQASITTFDSVEPPFPYLFLPAADERLLLARGPATVPDGLWRLMRFEIEEKWSGTIGGLRNQVARGRHCVLLLNGVTTVIQFPQ